jgi:hypothetical protein
MTRPFSSSGECQTDVAGAHAYGVTHLFLRERRGGLGEDLFDTLQGHWQINGRLASAGGKVGHEVNFLCSASIST